MRIEIDDLREKVEGSHYTVLLVEDGKQFRIWSGIEVTMEKIKDDATLFRKAAKNLGMKPLPKKFTVKLETFEEATKAGHIAERDVIDMSPRSTPCA